MASKGAGKAFEERYALAFKDAEALAARDATEASDANDEAIATVDENGVVTITGEDRSASAKCPMLPLRQYYHPVRYYSL